MITCSGVQSERSTTEPHPLVLIYMCVYVLIRITKDDYIDIAFTMDKILSI
jgi:hypothetical protein